MKRVSLAVARGAEAVAEHEIGPRAAGRLPIEADGIEWQSIRMA